jgi:beta-mannosidase
MTKKELLAVMMLFCSGMIFHASCQRDFDKVPIIIEINNHWEFSQAGTDNWMPAIVPGTVHSDLLTNGKIEDPNYRMNEDKVQWAEDKDWIYRTSFHVGKALLSASDIIELQFKGLDTYADVFLNDKKILEADNMFVEWKVDVKDFLVEGENKLHIYFHSPVAEGMKKLQQLDYFLPATNEQAPENERTNVFTRKAPFHYGWDWGPRLVTSGIWRPVVLKAWSKASIENVYIVTESANRDLAVLSGYVTINVLKKGKYRISLNVDDIFSLEQTVDLDNGMHQVPVKFELENPNLWWTNGLGKAYLYNFNFALKSGRKYLDVYHLDYGVRTLRLVQKPDTMGRSFYFELNGVPVFMKGADVIPPETLTPLVTHARYERLINNASVAHMNMVRIWGGAIYGGDYLYNLCDKNGILVWQDFMFACALQPGDSAHLENIRKEAEYNVKRLRNHASLALWCGNNENLNGWHSWGWDKMYVPEVKEFVWNTYKRIFDEILPAAVKTFDPKTEYWPSSPMAYGGKSADRKSGDEHDWTIWFGGKLFSDYGKNVPRFVSEYGLQSFPSMHTIRKFSEEQDWGWDSKVMRHRQRGKMPYIRPGFDGNDMIKGYMEKYYHVPDDFEDFVYVSQLLQAMAYKTATEAHRRNMPHCMGSLYWQLNDSWPTISWSTVDYYGHWKAAHYAIRDADKPVIVVPVQTKDHLKVYGVSDKPVPFDAEISVTVMDFFGQVISKSKNKVHVPVNSSQLVFDEKTDDIIKDTDTRSLVVVIKLASEKELIADNLFYFHCPKDLELSDAEVTVSAEKTDTGYRLTVSTNKLAKNVFLDTPGGEGFFTDNFFDLLPGEAKTVDLETSESLASEDITVTILNQL